MDSCNFVAFEDPDGAQLGSVLQEHIEVPESNKKEKKWCYFEAKFENTIRD